MYTFRQTRDLLAVALDAADISEEEYLLLWEANTSKSPDFPFDIYPTFHLDEKDATEVKAEFRFEKEDIPVLRAVLGIPESFTCRQGTVCDGMTGLCIVLKRLTYPCRFSDMMPTFGMAVPELCMVFNTVVECIFNQHGHLTSQWNDSVLSAENLERYAESIANKGAPLRNCFSFVDGTVRPICRPSKNQRTVYNGHKRVHSLKFHLLSCPMA